MKKAGGLLLLTIFATLPLSMGKLVAAGCSNVSSFGAVDLIVPTLPDVRSKVLWVRMQAPDTSSKVLAEVNDDLCLEIGGKSILPNQWSWQSSDSGPISFPSFAGNSIKLIGISNGVRIDRILLTETDCTPQDFGNNCRNSVELKANSGPPATIIPPPTNGAVGGMVVLTNTPDKNRQQLQSVEYYVDGKRVQTVNGPEPFDTTLVANGKHSVEINTKLKNGSVFREATVIDVRNPENAFTPVVRWLRLNLRLTSLVAAIIGGMIIVAVTYNLIRTWHVNKRQRKFHGF